MLARADSVDEPESIRAISSMRSSPWSRRAVAKVAPFLTFFDTETCASAAAATCARWVTTSTWW